MANDETHPLRAGQEGLYMRGRFTLPTDAPPSLHPLVDPERRELLELRAAVDALRRVVRPGGTADMATRQGTWNEWPELADAVVRLCQVHRHG